MTEAVSRRQHSKRHPGITETMRNTLLQARKQQQPNGLIDDLMQKLNASPKRTANIVLQMSNNSAKGCRQGQLPAEDGLHNAKCHDMRVSVNPMAILRPAEEGLRRVLSVDKVSFRINTSRLGRRGKTKKHGAGLLAQPPAVLSKKSTGYSTQSEEEVLREQNERFRELCVQEEGKLQRLQREIENENKVQLIRRQLYEESIKKLKRMAGVELFQSDTSNPNSDSIQESCEECDCLSVTSK